MGSCSQIANRRQARRFRAQHLAKIVLGPDSMISCHVEDISAGGAKIALDQHLHLPEDFELFIAAHDLQVHRARLCWRNHNSLGVSFIRSSDQPGQWRSLPHPAAQLRTTFQDEFDKVRVVIEREEKDVRVRTLRGAA
ncbi:PilZ domain-containing protein [Microvirga makkahensis]|uniref:PilZ domain-containing protein n=1 Tax=Microvirga makkahensis TaxID=1128670 RepID=A0A7X3MWT5_9HYPH|nr:PilZ domain-containing protein [Microvirga makkahensis]MXQ14410.1 hypothetical protein [Microvirga makkahensis]